MISRKNPNVTGFAEDTDWVLHVSKPVSAKQLQRAETISKKISKLKAELDHLIHGKKDDEVRSSIPFGAKPNSAS
jgi:hypothetical protein